MSVPSFYEWPRLVKKPKGRKVVVLAPHMDDEIIGCGGTLRKHVESGDRVSVIYMTSGTRGTRDFAASAALSETRKAEVAESNRILGVPNAYFLDLDDGTDEDWSAEKERLAALLKQLAPDLIYLPPYYDLHADHRKTNHLFKLAAEHPFSGHVCVYEVWTPVNPNLLVNITAQMERKMQAIAACKSQLESVSYDAMITGLNTYRGSFIFSGQAKYAEAFVYLPVEEYLSQF